MHFLVAQQKKVALALQKKIVLHLTKFGRMCYHFGLVIEPWSSSLGNIVSKGKMMVPRNHLVGRVDAGWESLLFHLAATLGANWVYWPSGSDFGQAQRRSPSQAIMFLTWMGSFTCSCMDTIYKEPQFTVPFDGHKEPRMISPMWPGIEPGTCRLLGIRDTIRLSGLLVAKHQGGFRILFLGMKILAAFTTNIF
jgi:hypothetical protein